MTLPAVWTLGERRRHHDDGAIHGDSRAVGDGDKLVTYFQVKSAELEGLNLAVRDITETP